MTLHRMHNSRFLYTGIVLLSGVLIALPGCGDDGDEGQGSAGTTTATTGGGEGGNGGDGGNGEGGNGGDGGSGGGGGGEGGGDPAAACETYCAAIAVNCVAVNEQYGNDESCRAFCSNLPEGEDGAQTGNTLACRLYHAQEAATDPDTHCVHAGPSGGGVCGTMIESFCEVAPKVCPDVHADTDACMTAVGGVNADPLYAGPSSTGDTLACRLYHLTEATVDDETHCEHTGAVSATCM